MGYEFWKALLIRTAKTWCQAFVAAIGVESGGRTLSDIDWMTAFSIATLAAIICFVWNLGIGLPEVKLQQTIYDLDNDPEDYDSDDEYEEDYLEINEEEGDV